MVLHNNESSHFASILVQRLSAITLSKCVLSAAAVIQVGTLVPDKEPSLSKTIFFLGPYHLSFPASGELNTCIFSISDW